MAAGRIDTPGLSYAGPVRRRSRMPADTTPGVAAEVDAAVDAAFREEWGRIVATLIAVTGDWDLAEECAQDAFTRALQTWARDGVPTRPGAWLTTTARNRAVDVLRRRANEALKLKVVAAMPDADRVEPHADDEAAE